jgi:hypothetical protein
VIGCNSPPSVKGLLTPASHPLVIIRSFQAIEEYKGQTFMEREVSANNAQQGY